MVFGLFVLNRVYKLMDYVLNRVSICPKHGIVPVVVPLS